MARDDPQGQLDTRAIEIASQALGKIDLHTAECARRYAEQADAMRDLRAAIASSETKRSEGFQRLYDALGQKQSADTAWRNTLYVAVILLLLGMVAFLVTNGRPWRAPDGPSEPPPAAMGVR